MEIINLGEVNNFAARHPGSRRPLANWRRSTEFAVWKDFATVRLTFRSADYVEGLVIFDVGGNNYRIIASVDYVLQRVYVLEVLTHGQYDRWSP